MVPGCLIRRSGPPPRELIESDLRPVGPTGPSNVDRAGSVSHVVDGPLTVSFPRPVRLRCITTRATISAMAVIERIGRPQARPYLVAWGRLTEEDGERLLARVLTARHVDVTVDLCEIEEVTDEGCHAIRSVAEFMDLDQTMVVLYDPDREGTRSLERTGIADDGRIVLVASSPSRRINI